MSAMAATGAALRLRLLFRMLRVGELIALAALLSWSSSRAPSAAAAALRVAGSLLFSPRFVFVLGTDDAEEFRRTVEAFIAKQTRFRREEESMAGTLVVVE
uniref:Predicted protein n=1 Tax=Hordeum vulgare subsp. vulgare TaxID=112509 RepID=F2DDW8_HORVV|nr:predicted protein [Hordeum vulgare subsp. vulgare]